MHTVIDRLHWVRDVGGLTARELAGRIWREIQRDDVLGRAAQLSYFFLLSLFPLLIFFASVAGLVLGGETDLYARFLRYMQAVMPEAAFRLVRQTMSDIVAGAGGGTLSTGLFLSLWTASMGVEAIIQGLNAAYDVREVRPWWRRRLVALLLTVVLTVMLLSSLALVLAGGYVTRWVIGDPALRTVPLVLLSLLRWALIVTFVLIAFNVLYVFGPNLKQQKWQVILPGSLVAVACWMASSLGFRLYLSLFDNYSRTYGSLGAVVVLMLWLYLSGFAVLLGGEVNAEIRNAAAAQGVQEAQEIAEGE